MKKVNELEKVIEEKKETIQEQAETIHYQDYNIEKCKKIFTKNNFDFTGVFKNKVDYKYDDPTA